MIFDILPIAMLLTALFLLGGVFVILILLEKSFIKKRKKGELILPILVTILAAVFIGTSGVATISSTAVSWASISVDHGDQYLGEISAILNRDSKRLKAIGTFNRDDGDEIEYIDLEIKDGKIVGTGQALPYKEALEESLKPFLNESFTGRSVDYDQLRIQANQIERRFSLEAFAYAIVAYGILPVILWLMYGVSKWRRKRRNLLRQTKLEDL